LRANSAMTFIWRCGHRRLRRLLNLEVPRAEEVRTNRSDGGWRCPEYAAQRGPWSRLSRQD
jgi:hypothetical protein